ncbi:histidinol dehydrogenase [Desulfonatronum thiosulfatophilum]|uniref:Histidinol dehydrogenase n=1 Tax=Desulfonatronum thiosulfatophilum TaxID=617002 RepID=A0A1G6EPU5_9BACT|nr:histidinol dehydrogenase [Desulfonatronum thiosulfatophilum]SDB58915.1 histidinol dehydrogenase [Desulfonatronum thiosulfatophilum]
MPCRELQYTSKSDWKALNDRLKGRWSTDIAMEQRVRDILDQVRDQGDAVLVDYTRRFDCPEFQKELIAIPTDNLSRALGAIPATDRAILETTIRNVREFHEQQKQRSWFQTRPDGTILGQMVRPVERVGLYVPGGQGGTTPLISSMIMNAVPALVAGVDAVAVVSPPRADGTLDDYLLATAALLNISEIYRLGSAWAIAALAHGTETVPPVDVIAGPGNIYVTTAKRLLVGHVGIDMIAGPSEIAILADDTANPEWLAADMLSQAEHDPLAASILISPSSGLLARVKTALEDQLEKLPRAETARQSLQDWGALIQAPSMETGAELVNLLAPEHLELCVADPWQLLGRIRNAGAIFMGHHCPEPVGDYFAGPNHVLPTLGTARFASGLSVDNFIKKSNIIATSCEYISTHAKDIARLATLEGLDAHARSVLERLPRSTG